MKYKVIQFSHKRNIVQFNYRINDVSLENVNMFNDLGILVSKNGISMLIKKAQLAKRLRNHVKKSCYMSIVRPLLEYGTVLWSPHKNLIITLIESVQRHATKYITNNYYQPEYEDRIIVCPTTVL